MPAKPDYAADAKPEHLVRIFCKGDCRSGRWAELNVPNPGYVVLNKAGQGVYNATCLMCGKVARDNYNWRE